MLLPLQGVNAVAIHNTKFAYGSGEAKLSR